MIEPSGYVGIGTTNPQEKLDVNGYGNMTRLNIGNIDQSPYQDLVVVHNNGTPTIATDRAGVSNGGIAVDSGGNEILADSNDGILFKTGVTWNGDWSTTGNTRMAILSNGNVGIGVTNPIRPLTITESGNAGEFSFVSASGTASTGYINVSDVNGNNPGSLMLRGLTSNGGAGTNLSTITLAATTVDQNGDTMNIGATADGGDATYNIAGLAALGRYYGWSSSTLYIDGYNGFTSGVSVGSPGTRAQVALYIKRH